MIAQLCPLARTVGPVYAGNTRSQGACHARITLSGAGMIGRAAAVAVCALVLGTQAAGADPGSRIGTVSTTFRLIGRNDQIAVDRYDDPKVAGVSCYLSHAETGGVKGSLGLATDPSRFSLACRATGKVVPASGLPDNEVVFGERTSFFFKELRVSRLYDRDKQVLLYLAWSTKAMTPGGSPYNAITAIPLDR